jgi:hypothetical protein
MANKINILELDINTSALITKMTETRAAIDKLKAAQKIIAMKQILIHLLKMKLKLKDYKQHTLHKRML